MRSALYHAERSVGRAVDHHRRAAPVLRGVFVDAVAQGVEGLVEGDYGVELLERHPRRGLEVSGVVEDARLREGGLIAQG